MQKTYRIKILKICTLYLQRYDLDLNCFITVPNNDLQLNWKLMSSIPGSNQESLPPSAPPPLSVLPPPASLNYYPTTSKQPLPLSISPENQPFGLSYITIENIAVFRTLIESRNRKQSQTGIFFIANHSIVTNYLKFSEVFFFSHNLGDEELS